MWKRRAALGKHPTYKEDERITGRIMRDLERPSPRPPPPPRLGGSAGVLLLGLLLSYFPESPRETGWQDPPHPTVGSHHRDAAPPARALELEHFRH